MTTILYNIILSPITQIIEIAYRVFDKMFKNTGIAVIGVSFAVTLLCLPLYIVAENWQETERAVQERLKPGIARIKRFFFGDEQYMILSTFYRQHHYHPIMALRSSFGILIQLPFFLAAYHTLSSLPDLKGARFLFICDMGEPDRTFFIGNFAVNILPIAMTLINCISGFIYSKGHGLREKVQIYGMALLFLVVLYNSPAGLVVYWTMNNVFSLVKNVFYKMKHPVKVFYRIICGIAVFIAVYILFFYGGGAKLNKRIPAAVCVLLLIPVPLYLRGVDYLLSHQFAPLVQQRKLRTSLFVTSALSLSVLAGLVLPTSLITSSVQEFSDIEGHGNPAGFLNSSFWGSFGLFVFWPTCIYFLFKEKIQSLFAFLFPLLLAASVVNAFIFTGSYGSMDATLKFIDGGVGIPAKLALANCAVLVVLAVLVFVAITSRFVRFFNNLVFITLAAFCVFSAVNIAKINTEYAAYRNIVVEEGEGAGGFKTRYHLSKTEKNVMIFMLDRFESAFVPFILSDFPALATDFDGFVYYKNSLSPNGHTLMGAPSIYGGYDYMPAAMNKRADIPLKDKHNEALLLLPTLFSEQAGFNVTVSDLSWANYSYVSDMSFMKGLDHINTVSVRGKYSGDFKKNCLKPGVENASLAHVLNRNLVWVSLFRQSPVALRPVVYYKGTWWENGVGESSNAFVDWFSALYYMPELTALDSERPTLSVITNEATHSTEDISMYDLSFPQTYSVPDFAYPVNCVTLQEIAKFCDFLKQKGCYDNTRIILVSDHGLGRESMAQQLYESWILNGDIKDRLNPLMMVKDFNSHGTLKTDMTFMTTGDVPTLALDGIVEDPVNPFTGNPVSSAPKKDGILITSTGDLFMPYHSKSKYQSTVPEDSWYCVKDNIFEDKNWIQVSEN